MSHHVLLIEDDSILQYLIVSLLEALNYSVVTATSVAEAHKLLADEAFDLVLLDMNLPDGNGLELLMSQKNTPNEGPLMIVTTAENSVNAVIGALRNGAFDYLTKPINLELMQRTLRRASEHINLRRAAIRLDQLQAQELAVRATARAAVHHLSQDLTVILGEAQLLEETLDDPESIHSIQRIIKAVDRASSTLATLRHARHFVTSDYSAGDTILDLEAAARDRLNETDSRT